MSKFSEYINSQADELQKAGDGYEALSDLSKGCIDYAVERYAKQSLEPINKILLDFADKQGWAVDFSDESYDGAKEAPMDRVGLLVHICETLAQFIENQSPNK